MNDNELIISDYKAKIKEIPIQERGKALAIFNLLSKYLNSEKICEDACKVVTDAFEKAQFTITTQSDMVIEGKRKVNEDELKWVDDFLNEGEEVKDEDNDGLKMDLYWVKVFKNKNVYISEADEPMLKHLLNLDISTEQDKEIKSRKFMKLKMTFEQNEFFDQDVLECNLEYNKDEPTKSTGTVITWKEGKDPTFKMVQKKQRNKKTGKSRELNKKEIVKSFFDIFSNYTADDLDEEEEGEAEFDKPTIYTVCDTLDDIMDAAPYSLEYYLDVAITDDFDGDFGFDEGLENVPEDDEDEEDEEVLFLKSKKLG